MSQHLAFAAALPFVATFIAALAIGARAMNRWTVIAITPMPPMKLVSTATMIQRLWGLLGTGDLTAWEQDFVRKLAAEADAGRATQLTGAQVDTLDKLHGRHFA